MKIDLDHVAIALEDIQPTLDVLVGDFGVKPLFGGPNLGFMAMQVDADGLRIELLQRHQVEQFDFLRRFIDANGEGPHHMTFKTDDIEEMLDRIGQAGYTPVGVNIDNSFWREAFIHPKEAGGTVIQVAQSSMDPASFDIDNAPENMREAGFGRWWKPTPDPAPDRASLQRVVVTTDDMNRAVGLYGDVLQGQRNGWGDGWVEFVWPSGGTVRLEQAAGRPEGVDRIEWSWPGPDTERTVGGARMALYQQA